MTRWDASQILKGGTFRVPILALAVAMREAVILSKIAKVMNAPLSSVKALCAEIIPTMFVWTKTTISWGVLTIRTTGMVQQIPVLAVAP